LPLPDPLEPELLEAPEEDPDELLEGLDTDPEDLDDPEEELLEGLLNVRDVDPDLE